jgi:trans-feruloyl-CoA hydratase/vanillin synthase
MQKSPAALRATKQALRQVRTMDVPQAYDYLAAKSTAMKALDKQDSSQTGMRKFLVDKSYKPAHEPFRPDSAL